MLRISRVEAPDEVVTLRLEGQVSGPWVDVLRTVCEQWLATGSALTLDLMEVSFVDSDGMALCRCLKEQQVAFRHYSPFVGEQLRGHGL